MESMKLDEESRFLPNSEGKIQRHEVRPPPSRIIQVPRNVAEILDVNARRDSSQEIDFEYFVGKFTCDFLPLEYPTALPPKKSRTSCQDWGGRWRCILLSMRVQGNIELVSRVGLHRQNPKLYCLSMVRRSSAPVVLHESYFTPV